MSGEKKTCWVMGKSVTLPNGHTHIVPPFSVFHSQADMHIAQKLVADASGETPGYEEAALYLSPTEKG